MYRFLLITILAVGIRAEIVDRIAITVGRQAITELQVDEELRVTAFLNHQPVMRNEEARRSAANRLVEQALVKHDMEMSRYPLPDSEEVDNYLQQVRADFDSHAPFDQVLAAYDLTENTLRDHLALQLTSLRFIEFRFRPDVGVSDSDIESYYQREMADWKANHPGASPPILASSRESVRKALIEARTDQVLNRWLEETRKQFNIVYLDKSLQ